MVEYLPTEEINNVEIHENGWPEIVGENTVWMQITGLEDLFNRIHNTNYSKDLFYIFAWIDVKQQAVKEITFRAYDVKTKQDRHLALSLRDEDEKALYRRLDELTEDESDPMSRLSAVFEQEEEAWKNAS